MVDLIAIKKISHDFLFSSANTQLSNSTNDLEVGIMGSVND